MYGTIEHLAFLANSAREDFAQDWHDAEETGERPDLEPITVEMSVEFAESVIDEIAALQARVAELETALKATLDREAVAYSRHDARAEAAEARVAELEVLLTTARQLVTHAATELAQSAQDMSAMRAERALHKAIAAIQEGRG